MIEKKAIAFPLWVEIAIVIVLLIMAGVEMMHDQWFWAILFGVSGAIFGIGAVLRLTTGDKHDEA